MAAVVQESVLDYYGFRAMGCIRRENSLHPASPVQRASDEALSWLARWPHLGALGRARCGRSLTYVVAAHTRGEPTPGSERSGSGWPPTDGPPSGTGISTSMPVSGRLEKLLADLAGCRRADGPTDAPAAQSAPQAR